jgi:hypothetical protein
MATYNAERKSGAISFSGTPGVATFSPASNCGTGNTLILLIAYLNATAANVTSVTDSAGNTWTVDVQLTSGVGRHVHICSCKQNVAALTTSSTITITLSAASSDTNTQIWLEEFTGQYDFDVAASQSAGTGTSVGFGTTAATASTDEFAVCVAVVSKSGGGATWTWTKDANYTNFTTAPPLPNASGTLSSAAHYRLLSATGTQTATDTTNNTTNSQVAAIATYKVAAGGGATPGSVVQTRRQRRASRFLSFR